MRLPNPTWNLYILMSLCLVLRRGTGRREGRDPISVMPLNNFNNGKGFSFKACTSSGRHGPTQFQCKSTHESRETAKVEVISSGPLTGVQVWTVPKNTTYSFTALGAGGGAGLYNTKHAPGAYVNAEFNLTKGEKIYILVGQPGQSACDKTTDKTSERHRICRSGNYSVYGDAAQTMVGGGGGGGGGSFVFKRDNATGELIPLVIAGGGGGSSMREADKSPIKGDGGISSMGPGVSAVTPENGPGGGGGWSGSQTFPQGGMALLEGAIGGETCHTNSRVKWQTDGGFGGGGGGCTAGGGGGGYTGGNVSMTDDPLHNGQGGSSYIHPDGSKPQYFPGANMLQSEGEVEIAFVVACKCEFICIYSDIKNQEFSCYCPPNSILAPDKISCIGVNDLPILHPTAKGEQSKRGQGFPKHILYGIISGAVVLLFLLVVFGVYCSYQRAKRKKEEMRLEALSSPDYQLDRLRQGGLGFMTEYNPNYDFGGPKCTLQDLREIPRDHLTLVRALGQGAFGEVYMGYLANVPRELRDLPVAVKTLPALCTDEAEMDFLMEALIMSKFSHPNIVRFIGVCFEKHPRYIVLELLEGGDLKTFLRESRPKPDAPSRVTMMDLVKLATDVACGCQYLEENHFIHRDIAARNCLLTTKGPERVAKIADFGMARDIYRADYYRKGGKAMLPVKWMPPEAFLDGIFTSKTDVWSFGILLWEVFSLGYMPYPGRGNQEVMQLVTAGGRMEPPQNCPTPVYLIMTTCWHGIPERRPTFAEIISKLETSMKDPEVIHSPLPVFHRPPSVERDTTVMRPKDPDRMVLTVDMPKPQLEPDSPNSMDPLISPQSPDLMQASGKADRSCLALDGLLSVCDDKPDTAPVPNCPTGVLMYEGQYAGMESPSTVAVANADLEACEDSNLLVEVEEPRGSSLPRGYSQAQALEAGGSPTIRTLGQADTHTASDSQAGSQANLTKPHRSSSIDSQEKVPVSSSTVPNTCVSHSCWGNVNPNFENLNYAGSGMRKRPVTYENVSTGVDSEEPAATGHYSSAGLGPVNIADTREDNTSRTSNGSEDNDRGDSGIVVDLRGKYKKTQANNQTETL